MKNARSLLKSGYQLTRFLTKLKAKPSSLLILTHDYPDPDALASATALQFLLEKSFQISSKIVYGGVVGRTENRAMVELLKLPIHKLKPADLKKYKQIALVDTQPDFKNNSFPKSRKAFLVIDQHPSYKKPQADCAIIDTDCGATCVILAEACLLLGLDLPTPVATALAYGILSDTLHLYRASRKDVIETYLAILPSCDMRALAEMQNPPRTETFFEILAKGIKKSCAQKHLIFSHLGFIKNPDVVSQMADLLLSYEGMKFSLCTGRFKENLHLSFRMTEAAVEAQEILRDVLQDKGSAGGHDTIAGGNVKVGAVESQATWDKVEEEIIQRLLRRLKIGKATQRYVPFRVED